MTSITTAGRVSVAGWRHRDSPQATWPAGPDPVDRAPRPVAGGDGFVFVHYRGQVYPSGFLPLVVGSVRERPLSEICRTAPELLALRDRSNLRGKCRWCGCRDVCGGSRARAYAVTGDPPESDRFRPHMPDPVAMWQARAELRPPVGDGFVEEPNASLPQSSSAS